MAGEIEEPFRIGFQGDSIHSGSISFGRFESEVLCWERRSSFSHNRYLEEVEKCSKPGLVIEKKAYFEAHFRKKGILAQNSPDCGNGIEYQGSDNEILGNVGYDEENDHANAESQSARFDESLDGSVVEGDSELSTPCVRGDIETSVSEPQNFIISDGTEDDSCIPEHVKIREANPSNDGDLLSLSSVEMDETLDSVATNTTKKNTDENCLKDQEHTSPKEMGPSEADCLKPRSTSRSSVAQNRKIVSQNKPSEKVTRVQLRSNVGQETSEAAARNKFPIQKNAKLKPGSKTQAANMMRSAQRESKSRMTVESQSSKYQKVSTRLQQSANSLKPATGTKKPDMKPESSRISFKREYSALRKKEFDLKKEKKVLVKEAERPKIQGRAQVKKEAEPTQVGKSLDFKATPMPSFYHRALRTSERKATVPNNDKPLGRRTKSSSSRTRVSSSSQLRLESRTKNNIHEHVSLKTTAAPQASGATSCHSTVTSDSCPPSPAAVEASYSNPSQAGRKNMEAQRQKERSLLKHQTPESYNNIHKGKTMDVKRNSGIGGRRSSTVFKHSSRTILSGSS